jgi:hypothetical protein
MAEVHVLPGIERRDLLAALPSEDLLRKAIENGVTDVLIVGRDRAGELYVAFAGADADRGVGMLMRAVQFLTSHKIENDQVIQTEPQAPS